MNTLRTHVKHDRQLHAAWLGMALLALAWAVAGCQKTAPDGSGSPDAPGKSSPPAAGNLTARQALEAMVATYRNAKTYQDQKGNVHLEADVGGQKIDDRRACVVMLARPNKFHVEFEQGAIISDAEQCWCFMRDLPNQIVKKAAPAEATLSTVFFDPLVKLLRTQAPTGDPPQLVLLTAKDPLQVLLRQAEEPELLEPAKIQEASCYRVSVKRPDGPMVFWIDQQSKLLRRVEYPVESIRQGLAQQGKVEQLRLTGEFDDAQVGGAIDPGFFRVELQAGNETVAALTPPDPGRLLGKEVPRFSFTGLDGKPVGAQSLSGKVLVLAFWATDWEPCRKMLPELEKVYQKFKDNSKVAFLAVSVDNKTVENRVLADQLKELQVTLPVARDTELQAGKMFVVTPLPATYLVGKDGVMQDFEFDPSPQATQALGQRIEKLLDSRRLYDTKLADYEERQKQLRDVAEGPEQIGPPLGTTQQPVPKATIASSSSPEQLKLKPLWKCDKLKDPGNIMVVAEKDKPRILVLDMWRSVVELDRAGQVLATHELDIPQQEVIAYLRTAVGKNGKRYYLCAARGLQQVHVFDADWKKVIDYPQDALENKHAGIGEAVLDDLDGDGTLKIYLGYLGPVGAHAVSLTGTRLWANRSLETVLGVAALPDQDGHRVLACVFRNTLVLLDAKGEKKDQVAAGRRALQGIVVADLEQSGKPSLCGLATSDIGVYAAVGIDLREGQLWSYDGLPNGMSDRPIEPIVAGRVRASGSGQWLLAGADGSVHILQADGKLLDRFNYGSPLCGLATVELNGQPALLVASPKGVEALQIER